METTVAEKKTVHDHLYDHWHEILIMATLIGAYKAQLNIAKNKLIALGQDVSMHEQYLKISEYIWEHKNDPDMNSDKARELISVIY